MLSGGDDEFDTDQRCTCSHSGNCISRDSAVYPRGCKLRRGQLEMSAAAAGARKWLAERESKTVAGGTLVHA